MKKRFYIGLEGEKIALNYLLSFNYSLLAQRYKTSYGEIDIIVADESTKLIIFCEIKSAYQKLSIENIQQKQKVRILDAIAFFLQEKQIYIDYQLRIDVIVVCGNQIAKHIENAWSA